MRRIEVTYSTMGQSSRAALGERKDYAWNGDPAKSEAARTGGVRRIEPLRGSPRKRALERIERYTRFCQLRDEGLSPLDAGREVGVERRAASRYEKQRREETQAS